MAGGVQAVMAELAKKDILDLGLMTVTGCTVGENIAGVRIRDHAVIRSIDDPYSATGEIAILRGNIAPTAVVKRAAVDEKMLVHKGPARVFDSEDEALDSIYKGRIKEDDVIIIRYEGPKGGPGMRRCLAHSAISVWGLIKALH